MQNKEKTAKSKQAYEKPRLRTIELLAEEVMGVGCKNTPATFGSGGGHFCTDGFCSVTPGS